MRRFGQFTLVVLVAGAVLVLGAWSTAPDGAPRLPGLSVLQPLAPAQSPETDPLGEIVVGATAEDVAVADATVARPQILSTASARIEDRLVERSTQPVALEIQRLGVAAPVVAAGAGIDGAMEVPDGVDEVAWYEFGSSPGDEGSAVLAAHVDMAGLGPGVFFDLHSLEPGDLITVSFEDGSESTFQVFESRRYLKEDLDTGRIFARQGPATLTLVTCGGGFNPSLGRYDSNVVVYAAPVEQAQP